METAPYYTQPRRSKWLLHVLLALLTIGTTTMAGAELATGAHWFTWGTDSLHTLKASEWYKGLPYMLGFVGFITFHEFGHYLTARFHKVAASLPFYIPLFIPAVGVINIGSLGAVIRMRARPASTAQFFDIGVAGPIAGFVFAVGILTYGFLTLPEAPPHLRPHEWEGTGIVFIPKLGNNLLFWFMENTLADPLRLPAHINLFHYPLLFSGYIALFFTALNLLPIGQLDGGHVTYGLFGYRNARIISHATVYALILYGGLGMIDTNGGVGITPAIYLLYLVLVVSKLNGTKRFVQNLGIISGIVIAQQIIQLYYTQPGENYIWLFYAFMSARVLGVHHPQALREHKLNSKRIAIGIIAILIFILCFTPNPIYLIEIALTPTIST